MIRAENISKTFGDRQVLTDVSALFEPGKTNLIIGKSGSGKTVFLKCLVGLLEVDEGKIYYDDVDFTSLDFRGRKELRKQMGMLFQGSALFDSMTVEENVRFPLDMFSSMSAAEKLERVNFCLERVKITDSNRLFPAELSGGMKKRVAIARAIVLKPRFLFCDEPNSGLDPKTSIVIDELIREITVELNMTTVVNTHDMNSVMENGEKIIFIEEGEKCWEGNRDEILKSDCRLLNDFIFANALARQLKDSSK
ncbi:MAG: ATP-binding cassette domain-containing protein [Bacteroidales bacterium]|jgi:phospholipid/cholesterol/gamma-HCH transport system ATP-binding protein|nr:ATP-binding cassette domain-containing protein [Bacteroidales bacterium]MDD3736108.1 ATP-binding cassette domain-containing protein [Bacteroidales bacterium]NLD62480.1 ATP-binding cassette domain-containing protein [Bacteroidales bacterium]HOO67115.1 ATP-binding cassette domain-containing protein [Bacteroidales bacterium]HPE23028.1 ATP-binding cassette domain-containing protein [Bacteroidales bacterium]